jgi:hypothetical protein
MSISSTAVSSAGLDYPRVYTIGSPIQGNQVRPTAIVPTILATVIALPQVYVEIESTPVADGTILKHHFIKRGVTLIQQAAVGIGCSGISQVLVLAVSHGRRWRGHVVDRFFGLSQVVKAITRPDTKLILLFVGILNSRLLG